MKSYKLFNGTETGQWQIVILLSLNESMHE
jgi:hypothetical protein